MPAKSAKQKRFMQAVANSPEFAKQVGVPQSVGKEFTKAAGGRTSMKKQVKMARGGKMPMAKMKAGGSNKMPMVEKDGQMVPAFAADGKGKMARGGTAKKMARGGKTEEKKMARGGKTEEKKMARGGMAKPKMARGGMAKPKMARGGATKKMGRGGGVDGCAMRGKTRGRVT